MDIENNKPIEELNEQDQVMDNDFKFEISFLHQNTIKSFSNILLLIKCCYIYTYYWIGISHLIPCLNLAFVFSFKNVFQYVFNIIIAVDFK